MKMVMRPRYYCDYCNKGNGSASAMKRHESGCTKNPERACKMCETVGNIQNDELFDKIDTDMINAYSFIGDAEIITVLESSW